MLLLYRGATFDPNFYYHAGVDIDHSVLLKFPKKKILIVHRLNESLAKKSFKGQVVVSSDFFNTLQKFIKNKSILVDMASLSARMAHKLQRICNLKDYSQELLQKRAKKEKSEIDAISRAAKYTREIFDSLDFKSAKTEFDIKKQILVTTAELGLEPAFNPIVSTGRNTSYPHNTAGNKKLGFLVLVDYGVRYRHYCSDLTRCFFLDVDRKKEEQYEKLQNVCHSLVDKIPHLKTGKQLDNMAKDLMKKNRFPKMIHAIGHGIGLDVHEFPRLSDKYDDPLAGAVFTIEPAFYLKEYGMRFEEMIYFDGKKAKIL